MFSLCMLTYNVWVLHVMLYIYVINAKTIFRLRI